MENGNVSENLNSFFSCFHRSLHYAMVWP